MAKYNKQQVLAAVESTGMVPVFYNSDIEISKAVVKACYEERHHLRAWKRGRAVGLYGPYVLPDSSGTDSEL